MYLPRVVDVHATIHAAQSSLPVEAQEHAAKTLEFLSTDFLTQGGGGLFRQTGMLQLL